MGTWGRGRSAGMLVILLLTAVSSGCMALCGDQNSCNDGCGVGSSRGGHGKTAKNFYQPNPENAHCANEIHRVSLPTYRVAPPDILFLDGLRLIPKPPYRIEPLEVLNIVVSDTIPNQPIQGQYTVAPEGTVNLGFGYGAVRVGGMTLDDAQNAIRRHLSQALKNPQVNVALAQFRGMQQVRGEHLIRPDGTISLGSYGSVYVAGKTLDQIKYDVECHLGQFFQNPLVSVDVFAYNSKYYYIIYDGAGYGQQIFRLPSTGNETVLDAISQVQGLAAVSSTKYIWVARPAPAGLGCSQILPVDWRAVTEAGQTATNYQIFPGDRIYVQSNHLIRLDNRLAQLLAPVERLLGFTLLGATTWNSVINANNTNNANGNVFP